VAVGRVGSVAGPADAPPPVRSSPTGKGRLSTASYQVEHNKADSHQGKEDDQVPDNFHHWHQHPSQVRVKRLYTRSLPNLYTGKQSTFWRVAAPGLVDWPGECCHQAAL
jgi:hypothetical protein